MTSLLKQGGYFLKHMLEPNDYVQKTLNKIEATLMKLFSNANSR